MAQKYVVQVVDDLDGMELEQSDVEEVRFGLDGIAYVIDLSKANAEQLRGQLTRYRDAARRDQNSVRGTAAAAPSPAKAGRKDLAEVRVWAEANEYSVSSRGRVPIAVLEAYDAR